MKVKGQAQPLVFRFSGVSPLCGAVESLYRTGLRRDACLCVCGGAYYLKVESTLKARGEIRRCAGEFGPCLGAAPALYAHAEEYGRPITQNAIKELGGALFYHRLFPPPNSQYAPKRPKRP